jgi:hypothetical protein
MLVSRFGSVQYAGFSSDARKTLTATIPLAGVVEFFVIIGLFAGVSVVFSRHGDNFLPPFYNSFAPQPAILS